MVKEYYLQGMFYDWVTCPKHLEKIFHRVRERETVKIIGKFGENSVTLDIGCGTGLVTRHATGSLVVGLDINQWNLKMTKTHASKAAVILGDGERLPIRSGSVGTIICTETLEHLPSPQNALCEMVRVLKPEGKIIGSVPSKSPVWHFRKTLTSTCVASEPFHKNYTSKELENLFKGLRILHISRRVFGLTLFFVAEKQMTSPHSHH